MPVLYLNANKATHLYSERRGPRPAGSRSAGFALSDDDFDLVIGMTQLDLDYGIDTQAGAKA